MVYAPKKYIAKLITNYTNTFGNKPSQYGNHIESDTSEELNSKDIKNINQQWDPYNGKLC